METIEGGTVTERWIEMFDPELYQFREVENADLCYFICRDRLAELAKERNLVKNNETLKKMVSIG